MLNKSIRYHEQMIRATRMSFATALYNYRDDKNPKVFMKVSRDG